MDIDNLISACENENNKHILSLTNDKILKNKVEIIDELPINKQDKVELINKLKGYMYVDEIHEIRNGAYLRWVNTDDIDNINIS